MLEADRLEVAYGDATALWGVSLGVGEGELVSVVGPNGSGKTTLINAIAGLLPVRSGTLRFGGEDLTRLAPHEVSSRGIALVPEGRRLFAGMTRGGEPRDRRLRARRPGAARRRGSSASTRSSPSCGRAGARRRGRSRAASSRWWPSAAP